MRRSLPGGESAASLAPALLLGLALALLYDLLRPVRRCAGGAAALLDLLFAVLAGAAVFLYAMTAPDGRMGMWELAAALAGFLLWEHLLCRVKHGLTAFFAQIRAKYEKTAPKFRQKRTSKN